MKFKFPFQSYKTLLIVKILFFSAALAGIGFLFFSYKNHIQLQTIVFVVDVSVSMNAVDISDSGDGVSISRLDAVKNTIRSVVEEYPQNQFALLFFADEAEYFLPVTRDVESFLLYIDALSTTNVVGKDHAFVDVFSLLGMSQIVSDIIVFSDMDFEIDIEQLDELSYLPVITFVGVGKKTPVYECFSDGVYVDVDGEFLLTERNDVRGRLFAETFNGTYSVLDEVGIIPSLSLEQSFLASKQSQLLGRYGVVAVIILLIL